MKCFNPKCTTGMPGKYEPVVLLWAKHHNVMSHAPAELRMNNQLVCEPCKSVVTPRTFINDQIIWQRIVKTFRSSGKQPPDLGKARLAFLAPDSLVNQGERVRGSIFSCR